ncbi:CSN8 [Symbiodinium necroappetens]|uniref:CSN8 protein n=1 Tax=Symbiodinium necroappetens TaxID=1628268 RepID=A0A812V4E2_9DINO|nr:CSN8 [Symbiodinium necroappetens]
MAGDPAAVLQQLHGQVSSWDAVQDELLLRALQSLRDGILRRAEMTEERLQKTARRAEAVGLKLRMASCSLEVLAQSQFLEHRVETEEDTVLEASAEAVEDIWSNLDVETAPEAEIEAIRQAFSLGQDFVHMKVDEDWPALPLVLGSEAWHSSWDAPQSVADFLAEDPPSPPRFEEPQPQAEAAQEDAEHAEHAEQAEQAEQEEHEALESSHHDGALPKPVAEEAPDLVSSLNALFARRGGPLEATEHQRFEMRQLRCAARCWSEVASVEPLHGFAMPAVAHVAMHWGMYSERGLLYTKSFGSPSDLVWSHDPDMDHGDFDGSSEGATIDAYTAYTLWRALLQRVCDWHDTQGKESPFGSGLEVCRLKLGSGREEVEVEVSQPACTIPWLFRGRPGSDSHAEASRERQREPFQSLCRKAIDNGHDRRRGAASDAKPLLDLCPFGPGCQVQPLHRFHPKPELHGQREPEGEDAGGPVGAGGPPLPVPGPKAKGKGKGKGKPGGKPSSRPTDSLFDDSGSLPVPSSQAAQTSPAKSGTSSLFDEPEMPAPVAAPAKPADPKALSLKPMASLFDDEPAPPAQKASPAKSGASSLFDDDAPSPPAKAPLTLKAGTSSLFDDETASGAPQPKAPLTLKSGMASLFDDDEPAKRPAAKTKVSPSPKKAPGPSLFSEQPPAKVAEHAEPASAKAKAVPKSAASLFDDVPLPVPASKSRAVTAKAPVPRAHDPLFDDEVAPKAASRAGALGPLGTSSGQPPPALPKSGGGIFDDAQASTTVPKQPKAASLLFDDSDPSAIRSSDDPPQVSGKGVGLLAAVTEPLPRKALPETDDSEPPKAPAKLPKAVESLFEEPSSDNAVGSAAMPAPAASRAKARPAAEASLFGDEPQGGAGTTSLFGNKPPPTPIRPGPSAASAVAALFDAPTSPIATTATAATPAPSSTTLAAAEPSQSPESAGAGAERPSLFGGARSVMASIFDDDDKTSATSFLAAKPASGHPARAGQPVESVTPGAPMAEGSGTAQTFTAEAVEPTVSAVSKAAPETSVKSTAAGRLAALRQRISSGSSGSDSDAAWEPEPTKPAASAKSTSLFGAPPAVLDPFEKPSEAPGPGGFPASAAPRKDSEREFPAPAKEDVKEERVEPVEKAAMSLPEPTSAERASGIESERPEPPERPSLFGGTKGPSGRTMNSIFDDDDDDDFIKPGPLAKAGLGASSGPPRSSLSSLFGEPGPAGPPWPSPGPPLPMPSKAPPTSASSLADPLRASQGTLKTVQQKEEEKDQDVQSPPNKVDPLGGLRMKPSAPWRSARMSEEAPIAALGASRAAEVLQLVAAGRFEEILSACEELELAPLSLDPSTAPPSPEQVEQQGLLCAVHLLAYLLEGQLDSARFLWKRTPAAVQQYPQAAAAHRVLAARWRRQYAEAFAQLQAGPPWDSRLQPLVAEVVSRSREGLLEKIGKAYKVVSLSCVAAMLGIDAVAALDAEGNVSPSSAKPEDDLMQMGEARRITNVL